MKKNFYELSSEEKSKFKDEFNKLKFTKNVNAVRAPSLFVAIFGSFLSGILSNLANEGVKIPGWFVYLDYICFIAIVLFILLEVYFNITFMRWMKIKHDVEY